MRRSRMNQCSRCLLIEAGEEAVEDLLAADLALAGGIVALALESRPELYGGDEERAGLADRFETRPAWLQGKHA
jgi:hypothetical protein